MSFDPVVAMVQTRYGFIKFYTNSSLQTYLQHIDSTELQMTPTQKAFKKNIKKLTKLVKKPRGRPKGSKNKVNTTITQPTTKAEKHIVTKEQFETNAEFKIRKQEELALQ